MNQYVDPKRVGIPRPPVIPMETPEPIQPGWWLDPAAPGYPQMRYHNGDVWTEFVAAIRTQGNNGVILRPFTDEIDETPEGPVPKAALIRSPLPWDRVQVEKPKRRWRWPWSRSDGA